MKAYVYDAATGEAVTRSLSKSEMDDLKNSAVSPYLPSVLYPTDLWRRMTDAEVSAVESVMVTQPARIQRIFNAATEYRSDDELWPLLEQIATNLFGADRAAHILAPST